MCVRRNDENDCQSISSLLLNADAAVPVREKITHKFMAKLERGSFVTSRGALIKRCAKLLQILLQIKAQ